MAKIRTMLAIVPLLASGRTVAAQNATSGSAQGATSGPLQTGQSYDGQWSDGPWSPCNQKCGTRQRKIECRRFDQLVENSLCDPGAQPASIEPCPCDETQRAIWTDPNSNTTEPYPFMKDTALYANMTEQITDAEGDLCPNARNHWVWGRQQFGDWSPCDAQCGGSQKRDVLCIDEFGLKASQCPESQPPSRHTCGKCEQDAQGVVKSSEIGYYWRLSPWSQCPAGCGGFQERKISCVTFPMHHPINITKGADDDFDAGEPFPVLDDNSTAYYSRNYFMRGIYVRAAIQYVEHSENSTNTTTADFDEGLGFPAFGSDYGNSNEYFDEDESTYPNQTYGDANSGGVYGGYGGEEKPPLWYDVVEVNPSLCGMHAPPTVHPCGECETLDKWNHYENCTDGPNGMVDVCSGCSGHGHCEPQSARCICDAGWFGANCDRGCPPGWSAEACTCCPSGVFNATGACCPATEPGVRPVLDSEGRCCAKGRLDPCGSCDGDGSILDINGQCCMNDVPMDGRLECCYPPKTIDQCGICGGNDECNAFLLVDFYVGVPEGAVNWMSDAQFRADIDSIILSYAPNYGVGNVSIASTTEQKEGFLSIVKTKLWVPDLKGNGYNIFKLAAFLASMPRLGYNRITGIFGKPSVEGKCGDGVCQPSEILEVSKEPSDIDLPAWLNDMPQKDYHSRITTTCLQDCPVNGFCSPDNDPFAAEYHKITGMECSGRGTCSKKTRTCNCFQGYAGEQCKQCDVGYAVSFLSDHEIVCEPVLNQCGHVPLPFPSNATNSTTALPPKLPGNKTDPWPGNGTLPIPGNDTRPLPAEGGLPLPPDNNLPLPGNGTRPLPTDDPKDPRPGKTPAPLPANTPPLPGNGTLPPPTDDANAPLPGKPPSPLPADKLPPRPVVTPDSPRPPVVSTPRPPEPIPSVETLPYVTVFSEWSECIKDGQPVFCGGGQQTRSYQCINSNGEPAGLSNCKEVQQARLTQRCGEKPCETFSYTVSDWTPCSVACGTGFRTRRTSCISSNGYTVPLDRCPGERPTTAEVCTTETCATPYYVYSSWSACSEPCGSEGVMTRSVQCFTKDRTSAGQEVCRAEIGEPNALTANCNRQPCESFIWKATDWSSCMINGQAARCGGTRERTLTCFKLGDMNPTPADPAMCPDSKPEERQSCRPCSFCEDPALNQGCMGKGTCTNDQCVCEGSWTGVTCSVDGAKCASGVTDRNGSCCASSVLDGQGNCCEQSGQTKPILDKDGKCCSKGVLDGCGLCGSDGLMIDINGVCCPKTGILTTLAVCCASGNIDKCGVCDGKGDTCGSKLKTNVGKPSRAPVGRRLSQDTPQWVTDLDNDITAMTVTALSYPPSRLDVDTTMLADGTSADVDILLNSTAGVGEGGNAITDPGEIAGAWMVAAQTNNLQSSGLDVQTVVVCGDQVCSPGEPPIRNSPETDLTCGSDCPITIGSCDAPGGDDVGDSSVPCGGFGTCNLATLTCNCFTGYAGDACGYCAAGYVRNGQQCEIIISAVVAAPDGPPSAPPTREPATAVDGDKGSTNKAGLIAGLTLMSIVIVAMVVGGVWAFKAGKIGGNRNNADQYAVDAPPPGV